MVELIATITLIGSLTGVGVILYRKIPQLNALPPAEIGTEKKLREILKPLAFKVKSLKIFEPDFFENVLQKLLSKIKVLAMKVENKISKHLEGLRKKAQKRQQLTQEKYWQEVENSMNSEK